MSNELLIGLLCITCLVIGAVFGSLVGGVRARRRRAAQCAAPTDAPVPAVDPGYDPDNPMNAGRRRETVEMCGATWYRM